jgi:cellulose synthase/poly-beta-1,6-N-acetylglucosamine synthase-like glycosyltransferase
MISVIIPTYNDSGLIRNCLRSLSRQSFPKNKYEVIVVDDGSEDNTSDVVSKFKARFFHRPHRGPAAARNFGATKARGDILLFTDADCVPDRDWIRKMSEPFKDREIVGVSGTYRTLNRKSPVARFAGYEIEERHRKLARQKFIDFIGTFSAGYRKSVFRKFGGFDTKFGMASGEDPELSFRISRSGAKMVFQKNAFVYHNHPDSIWKFIRQKFWRGYWRVRVYRQNRSKIMKHSYTPKSLFLEEALTGATVISFMLTLFGLVPLAVSLVLLILLFALTLPFSYRIFRKDRVVGMMSPGIIILRNVSTGLGIVCGILFSRR